MFGLAAFAGERQFVIQPLKFVSAQRFQAHGAATAGNDESLSRVLSRPAQPRPWSLSRRCQLRRAACDLRCLADCGAPRVPSRRRAPRPQRRASPRWATVPRHHRTSSRCLTGRCTRRTRSCPLRRPFRNGRRPLCLRHAPASHRALPSATLLLAFAGERQFVIRPSHAHAPVC